MADGSARGTGKSSWSSAIAGAVLALPFAAILSLLLIGGDPPPLGPLEPLVTVGPDQPNVVGSAIVVGAWVLALAAFIVNVVPVTRDVRAGRGIATSPANLLVAAAAFALVAFFIGAIIVDQYPCWIGVPNCD